MRVGEDGMTIKERYGKEKATQVCREFALGMRELPADYSKWDCYELLMSQPQPFSCDWGHSVFGCTGCFLACAPKRRCNHHGIKD